ncbi:MAG: helix-turn-helix domain-containing protein [Lachnospiraceae bacterium]|nr:helix-turn-helix domain-containing protein [Lachnospiraceae bacterium]
MRKEYLSKYLFNENELIRGFFNIAPYESDMHSHDFWEISYVYEGGGVCYMGNQSSPVKCGSVLFAAPNTPHCFISHSHKEGSPLRICSIVFKQNYLELFMQNFQNISELKEHALFNLIEKNAHFSIIVYDDNASNLRHLIWLITHEYNHYTAGSKEIIQAAMLSLFIGITRQYEYQSGNSTDMVTKNLILDELLKYINANYGSRLSLELLASHAHLSREYLCRYFKKQIGINISDYILEVRINKAMEMLRNTTHTITDIGIFCGYPSVSSFQRSFKKYTGITPSEYRGSAYE